MKWLALLSLCLLALPAAAQTNTPTPSPDPRTYGLPQVIITTYTPNPSATATRTPRATMTTVPRGGWLFPSPSYLPITRTPMQLATYMTMTPGGGFRPANPPDFSVTSFDDAADGFTAISSFNQGQLIGYIILIAGQFWSWMAVNSPSLIRGAKTFIIIMMVIYGLYLIWKRSKYTPPEADGYGFGDTLSQGGRGYYNIRRAYDARIRREQRQAELALQRAESRGKRSNKRKGR
jgi:hypothetical protein